MKFSFKQHGGVLAACDAELLGSRLAGKHAEFYSGRLVDEKELGALISSKTNINLAGEETIKVAERLGLVLNKRQINGVPFALILKMKRR